MEIIDTYKTLKAQSEGIYKEKGSKFIGYAVACYDEEEAKNYETALNRGDLLVLVQADKDRYDRVVEILDYPEL